MLSFEEFGFGNLKMRRVSSNKRSVREKRFCARVCAHDRPYLIGTRSLITLIILITFRSKLPPQKAEFEVLFRLDLQTQQSLIMSD